jgi:ligand-binding SRPBCC domain-containing protein
MPQIHITTFIAAPRDRVFDLCRNISLHKISAQQTKEQAIAGVTSGPINLDETVTWKARHLGKTRTMQVRITKMEKPSDFTDEQVRGDFISFRHEHHFKPVENGTIMIEILDFTTPYGYFGKMFNVIYLKKYLENFLVKRNEVIKRYAESDMWRTMLT